MSNQHENVISKYVNVFYNMNVSESYFLKKKNGNSQDTKNGSPEVSINY